MVIPDDVDPKKFVREPAFMERWNNKQHEKRVRRFESRYEELDEDTEMKSVLDRGMECVEMGDFEEAERLFKSLEDYYPFSTHYQLQRLLFVQIFSNSHK